MTDASEAPRQDAPAVMPTAEKTVLIINRLGLHARAASKFVTLASSYESELTVEKDGKQVPGSPRIGPDANRPAPRVGCRSTGDRCRRQPVTVLVSVGAGACGPW